MVADFSSRNMKKKSKARKMPDAKQPIYSQKGNSFYNKTVMEARFNY